MKNQKEVAEKIRSQYFEREVTRLEELKNLDRKVKRPVEISAYIFGCIGALVLGTGMSFAMEEIGNSMPLGIAIGCLGILIVSINYFIYKKLLSSRKRKYSQKIIEASDNLINSYSTNKN